MEIDIEVDIGLKVCQRQPGTRQRAFPKMMNVLAPAAAFKTEGVQIKGSLAIISHYREYSRGKISSMWVVLTWQLRSTVTWHVITLVSQGNPVQKSGVEVRRRCQVYLSNTVSYSKGPFSFPDLYLRGLTPHSTSQVSVHQIMPYRSLQQQKYPKYRNSASKSSYTKSQKLHD